MKTFYGGIDLGGSAIKFGLCDVRGEVLHQSTRPSRVDAGPDRLLKRLIECGTKLREKSGGMGGKLAALGIGTPGTVDPEKGQVVGTSPNIPGWEGVEIRKPFENRFNIPISVENDVNAMAWAEYKLGASVGYKHVLAITVGTGIGGGIVLNGDLYRGFLGAAGEIGHMTLVRDGRKCPCGRLGCFERYASGGYLIEEAQRRSAKAGSGRADPLADADSVTVGFVMDLYRSCASIAAFGAVSRLAENLATGIAAASALVSPELIILGGGGLNTEKREFFSLVRKETIRRLLPTHVGRLKIARARLGNRAGFVGAALLSAEL